MKRVLVPVQGATIAEGTVTVPYDKSRVKDSPDSDGDAIDDTTERDLCAWSLPDAGRDP